MQIRKCLWQSKRASPAWLRKILLFLLKKCEIMSEKKRKSDWGWQDEHAHLDWERMLRKRVWGKKCLHDQEVFQSKLFSKQSWQPFAWHRHHHLRASKWAQATAQTLPLKLRKSKHCFVLLILSYLWVTRRPILWKEWAKMRRSYNNHMIAMIAMIMVVINIRIESTTASLHSKGMCCWL